MKLGGFIGAVIGYFSTKNFIGALIGYFIGTAFDNTGKNTSRSNPNFEVGKYLMMLSSVVMKADGVTKKSELNFVKQFFVRQFGEEKAQQYVRQLKYYLDKNISEHKVSTIIKQNVNHSSRVQLLHYLIGIAVADGEISQSEMNVLRKISTHFGLTDQIFRSLLAMYNYQSHDGRQHRQTNSGMNQTISIKSAYDVLEIPESATEAEIKKAYRKLVVKYHPDKVSQLGEEFQKGAKEKFQKVQDAYERIKEHKNIK